MQLIELTRTHNRIETQVWVNPLQIKTVDPHKAENTRIILGSDYSIIVKETPAEINEKIREAKL